MATELCTACGCGIVNNRTPAGPAVRHSDKLYCAECAALILSPEELIRLAKPTALPARTSGSKAAMKAVAAGSGGEAVGEELPAAESAVRPSRRTTGQPNARPGARSGRGNRRLTSVVGKRESSVIDAREQARSGRGESPRGRQRAADNTLMYIIMGVAAVALCAVGYFVFLRDGPAKKKAAPVAALDDSDKTTSTEYARRAEEYVAKSDTVNAAAMYRKAADKAEREKNTDQAKIYSMKIVSLEKSSTIKSLGGGK